MILARFPAGGRFNKRRKTNRVCAAEAAAEAVGLLRGEHGGARDTSSCRKETEMCVCVCLCVCVERWGWGCEQKPRTGLFNPAVNPNLTFRRLLPPLIYLCARQLEPLRTAERTRTGSGGEVEERAAACCSRRGQENENHRVHGTITGRREEIKRKRRHRLYRGTVPVGRERGTITQLDCCA